MSVVLRPLPATGRVMSASRARDRRDGEGAAHAVLVTDASIASAVAATPIVSMWPAQRAVISPISRPTVAQPVPPKATVCADMCLRGEVFDRKRNREAMQAVAGVSIFDKASNLRWLARCFRSPQHRDRDEAPSGHRDRAERPALSARVNAHLNSIPQVLVEVSSTGSNGRYDINT